MKNVAEILREAVEHVWQSAPLKKLPSNVRRVDYLLTTAIRQLEVTELLREARLELESAQLQCPLTSEGLRVASDLVYKALLRLDMQHDDGLEDLRLEHDHLDMDRS